MTVPPSGRALVELNTWVAQPGAEKSWKNTVPVGAAPPEAVAVWAGGGGVRGAVPVYGDLLGRVGAGGRAGGEVVGVAAVGGDEVEGAGPRQGDGRRGGRADGVAGAEGEGPTVAGAGGHGAG